MEFSCILGPSDIIWHNIGRWVTSFICCGRNYYKLLQTLRNHTECCTGPGSRRMQACVSICGGRCSQIPVTVADFQKSAHKTMCERV